MAVLVCRNCEERTMSSFEIGAPRPVSAAQAITGLTGAKPVQTETPAVQATPSGPANATAAAAPQVETSDAVKPGAAPVDQERVRTIRQAVESGKYPLFPAKIADAMIAAGMLLRSPHS
jgi:negative regulator of flagellin synthesis FlgM